MLRCLAVMLLVTLSVSAVFAQPPKSGKAKKADSRGLDVGDVVPDFVAKDDTGAEWKLSDHVGKKVLVVYFYPADMTGGCTKQACGFRDHQKDLGDANVEVVGVSGDSVENHKLFKAAHNLNFALLADESGEVAKVFGVPTGAGATIAKEIDGKEFSLTRGVTAQRWTYVIGLDGKIVHKNTEVNAVQDSQKVLEVVQALSKP